MSFKKNEIKVRTRYAETDQMGVVHHANYALYFEMGRTEWLREMGLSYKQMEENGVMLPVVSMGLNYKKPALYDEVLKVVTKLKKRPTVKIEFDYEIYNEKDELLVYGNTVLAFVDIKKNRPVKCPNYILDKL